MCFWNRYGEGGSGFFEIDMKLWITDEKTQLDGSKRRETRCNGHGVLGFVGYCLSYFLTQAMAFVTMWFANLAKVNPGIITVIWALGPLYMALADRYFYKT